MKKIVIILLIIMRSSMAFAEYAIIDNIVYSLNLERLTAIVLNFQDVSSDVTIPSHVYYRGDKYIVCALSHYDFESNVIDSYYNAYHTQQLASSIFGDNLIADIIVEESIKNRQKREQEEQYFQYDYKYSRSTINTLQLPNTIEYISSGALDGMTRLRALFVPASVKELPEDNKRVFSQNMPRLEHIVIMGLPSYRINGDKKVTFASADDNGNFDYIERLKNKFDISQCPNLKSFQVPKLEEKRSILNAYKEANQALIQIVAQQNNEISRSPYNNGAKIATPVLKPEVCVSEKLLLTAYQQAVQYIKNRGLSFAYQNEVAYIKDSLENDLRKHPFYNGSTLGSEMPQLKIVELDSARVTDTYLSFITRLEEQYRELIGGKMEQNLRSSNPEKFVKAYQSVNPNEKTRLDSIQNEYRCLPQKEQFEIIIAAIDGNIVNHESCRQKLWTQYGYLFNDRTEFEQTYYTSTNASFDYIIYKRQSAQSKLKEYNQYVVENVKQIKIKNMYKKPNEQTRHVIDYLMEFKRSYYYSEAIKFLLSQYPKVLAEYDKNKKIFVSQIDFFDAYTSENYAAILRNKKNK